MNTYKYIIAVIGLAAAGVAYGQESESNTAKTIAPNLIMGVTPEGEVQFYKYVEPLVIPQEPTTEEPKAYIHYSAGSSLPDENVYLAAQPMALSSQLYQPPEGYRSVPGAQGSYEPITEEEEADIIESLARYATEQAHEAAKSLCGMGAIRPESVSFTVGASPLQATVGWSVDDACGTGQGGE